MPKIVIDGTEIEAHDGETILNAALRSGIEIPHFCYHPRLELAGNCRMCLVEIEKVPKLQISCGTPVRDGMVVFTKNDRVRKAREAVMEFLLIHHPLDCPICDQCGECKLQDYSFEYGKAKSRFAEKKNTDPPLSLGKTISHNQNRCINCTRCIRFMRDMALDECLGLSERGGHTIVGTYLDKPIDNPFSVNIVDICPVGALTEKHFRFRARPWLMKKTATLCPGCSRGCNVIAWSYKGEILRLTPRTNEAVNLEWLCDEGRVSFDRITSSDRIPDAYANGSIADATEVTERIAEKIRGLGRGRIGVIGSGALTNEDNFALRVFAGKIGADKIYLAAPPVDEKPFGPTTDPLPEWFIRNDKTPGSRGAKDMLGAVRDYPQLLEDVRSGEIKGLLVFGADPVGAAEGGKALFKKLEWMVAVDTYKTKTVEGADLVLPEASAFEKEGTFTNEGGHVQRIAPVIPPLGVAQSTWQTVSAVAQALDGSALFASVAEVFDALSKAIPAYGNISLARIGALGVATARDLGE